MTRKIVLRGSSLTGYGNNSSYLPFFPGYWQPLAAIWGRLGADKYCFWYLATNPGCCRGWRCSIVSQIVKIPATKCLWAGRVGSRWVFFTKYFPNFSYSWKDIVKRLQNLKISGKISQKFVAFSENLNFITVKTNCIKNVLQKDSYFYGWDQNSKLLFNLSLL